MQGGMVSIMGNGQAAASLAEVRQLVSRFLPAAEAATLVIQKPSMVGFSGAAVWLLSPTDGSPRYVLKQLPAAVPARQLGWTQQLGCFLNGRGLNVIPLPIAPLAAPPTGGCGGLVADEQGQLWQCLTFCPGQPVPRPTATEVVAAVSTLAAVHRAAAGFGKPQPTVRPTGWQTRVSQLTQLSATGLPRPAEPPPHLFADQAVWQRLVAVRREVAAQLADGDQQRLAGRLAGHHFSSPLQPVLRDSWWAHLLFAPATGDRRVTGLIDLDAAGIDSPAIDLARLLGSWQLESADQALPLLDRWPEAFRWYADCCRPAGDFPAVVQLLHDTAVICGLDRWLHWLFREQRDFADYSRVVARLEALLRALPAAIARLRRV